MLKLLSLDIKGDDTDKGTHKLVPKRIKLLI